MIELKDIKNKVFKGDCLEWMKKFPDQSFDMIICDLPYGEVNRKSSGLRNLDKGIADICDIDLEILSYECGRICKGTVYLFCGIEQISSLTKEFKKNGLSTRLGQWEKTNPSPMNGTKVWLSGSEFCVIGRKPNAVFNRHCEKPIWKYPVGRNKLHPTQKPIPLFEYIIESSSNIGDSILDMCAGSGTTLIAALNTKRNCTLIEKEEEYYNIIIDRFKKYKEANLERKDNE